MQNDLMTDLCTACIRHNRNDSFHTILLTFEIRKKFKLSYQYAVSADFQSYPKFQPSRGKTNNVVFEQVRHKPGCTATDDSQKLEILDLRRGIVLSV